MNRQILYGIFFLSGVAGLVYQVLWMRYFQLLFGNTAKAAAVVLAVFFLGLGIGSWIGGRLVARARNPLSVYGWVEVGIALAAAPVLFLLPLYERLVASTAFSVAPTSLSADVARLLVAVIMTLPAGTLLGATFPIMGTVVITSRSDLGHRSSLLYGLNTLGAAVGVVATGFVLPAAIGVSLTYALALAINLAVGAMVLLRWRGPAAERATASAPPPERHRGATGSDATGTSLPRWLLLGLAFGSGAGLIGLEVLWTRMFALVFQNSVYSFSAIVLTVLVGLSASALIVSWITRRLSQPINVLGLTLGLTAIGILLTPAIFFEATGLAYFAYGVGWPWYVYRVVLLVAGVLLVPVLCAGATLPLLWQLFGRHPQPVGMTLGVVNLANLLGAVAGAAGAGFLLIPAIGLWTSIVVMAVVFLVLSLVTLSYSAAAWTRVGIPATVSVFVVLTLFVSNPSVYPVQRLKDGETLLYLDEGADAAVSVVEDASHIRWLKSNNTYSLGATASVRGEKRLGHLPLLLHPAPKDVAFVGIGTGISMSAGLDHSVDRLVGIEILPGVLDAAGYFSQDNRNVLADPRVTAVTGDGRIYLRTTAHTFDVIVSDLFVPWHAGTGNLYTLEHFEAGRSRLNPGGLYCQWLPLYQMSEWELGSIAATFARAFPYVSIWRGDFSSAAPIVGLVGSLEPIELNADTLTPRLERLAATMTPQDPLLHQLSDLTLFYAGDLKSTGQWLDQFPLNTDDRPVIEFLAPISQSRQRMFTGGALASFYRHVQEANAATASSRQPVLAASGATATPTRVSPEAGNLLFQAVAAGVNQDVEAQLATIRQAVDLLPGSNVLSIVDVVLKGMETQATRGVVPDQRSSR